MSKTRVKSIGSKLVWGVLLLALPGCDLEQLMNQPKKLSEVDSKAVGAACRHAGRALEDCFLMNPLAKQAGVFEGWRDMNDYMVANKIEVVAPTIVVPREGGKNDEKSDDHAHHQNTGESKSSKSAGGKTEEDYASLPRPPRFKPKPRSVPAADTPEAASAPAETNPTSPQQADSAAGSAEGVAYSGKNNNKNTSAVKTAQENQDGPQRVWMRRDRPKT